MFASMCDSLASVISTPGGVPVMQDTWSSMAGAANQHADNCLRNAVCASPTVRTVLGHVFEWQRTRMGDVTAADLETVLGTCETWGVQHMQDAIAANVVQQMQAMGIEVGVSEPWTEAVLRLKHAQSEQRQVASKAGAHAARLEEQLAESVKQLKGVQQEMGATRSELVDSETEVMLGRGGGVPLIPVHSPLHAFQCAAARAAPNVH